MRLGIFLPVVFLGILHRAPSVPHGVLPSSAYAVGHDTSLQVSKAPADECKDASSSGSQKCGKKTVTHEKTVITIEKTVETEIVNDDKAQECKGCPDNGTTTKAPATTPPTTPVPCTSTTPQTPTVPTTPATTTTTESPTSPTTPQTPTVPTTPATTTTTEPPTSPTTPQTPTVPTTPATTTTTEPPTSPTTPQTSTVPTTPSTTRTMAPKTSPTPPGKDPVTKKPEQCNPDKCEPPKCMCESKEPPVPVKDMPQFVMLTFDDAVNQENMKLYQELLAYPKRKNKASGCRIAATFFASAEYLDYPSVNELYRMGNEIALHSISHKTDGPESYWNDLNTTGWEAEVVDERLMVEKYAKVPARDIRGLRGPFLFTGGDAGFQMLHNHFDYDCTLIHKRDGINDTPVFPYTLDYGFQKPCMLHKCPNDTYPGLWTVPLNYLFIKDKDKYNPCSMADACKPPPETSQDTFEYLRFNFESFYNTNRAPFPVFLHEAWLRDEERKKGYLRFVDWLLEKEDVYLVTVSEVIDFMRYHKSGSSYAQRRCTKEDLPASTCPIWTTCHYPTTTLGGERYMRICGNSCPKNYPWVNNPHGNY